MQCRGIREIGSPQDRSLRRALPLFVIAAWFVSPAWAGPDLCPVQDFAIEAALGNAVAQYNLGVELYRGERLEQNLEKAAALWRMAVASGNVPAHNSLGYLVFFGRGVQRDPEEGLRLWRFAAERGHAESQFHLASVYMTGRHLPRDYALAYAWANTSEHYAKAVSELGGGPQVAQDARALKRQARENLAGRDRKRAEKLAAKFIASYGPREAGR